MTMNGNYIYKNLMNKLLLNLSRSYSSKLPEGIPYYGFTYYPRHENFKDPPYEATKLFLIKRIKSVKGRNPEEKECLKRLNIDGKPHHKQNITIVKNIPQINTLLWKIKHLIEIKPIFYSGELPKDYCGTYLRETGELVISPKLKVSDEVLKVSQDFESSEIILRKQYLKDKLMERWNKGEYNI